MAKLITITDMHNQVAETLGVSVGDFDIEAIVEAIHRAHGLIDIDDVNGLEFWQIVALHDRSVQDTPGPGGV